MSVLLARPSNYPEAWVACTRTRAQAQLRVFDRLLTRELMESSAPPDGQEGGAGKGFPSCLALRAAQPVIRKLISVRRCLLHAAYSDFGAHLAWCCVRGRL
jgi:hypothetical protein